MCQKLSSQRLVMEKITEKDWDLFNSLHVDSKVIALCFDLPSNCEIRNKFNTRLDTWSPSSTHWLCLVVRLLGSNEAIGISGFQLADGTAEVGFMFLPQYHGRGYATESLKALVNWATSQYGISKYQAIVTGGNEGSEAVLVKSGFTLSKVIPQAYSIGGKLFDDHIYCLENIVT